MSNDDVRADPYPQSRVSRLLLSVGSAERAAFFPAGALEDLSLHAAGIDIVEPEDARSSDAVSLAEIAVVAWGFPRLDADMLARMPRLRLVVNAASSVRGIVSDEFWASGIPISQAGAAMSPAVAEMSLTLTLSLLRRVHRMDHALRNGTTWAAARDIARAREISGCRIGVIGASRTGREYIRMCTALGADVQVFDPYLREDDPLSTLAAPLDELLSSSDVVAIHAPATAETAGMIGRRELAAMPDGAALVNTARASLVDMDALFDEVASGRLDAALDVFESEPLPDDDRWRSLPNALLTGHVSGATKESRARAGRIVIGEIARFLADEDLQHRVAADALERMG
ncbi:hydroxyacid dehydrogenase [Microbacterium sp. TPD7012]|uniref:hydroxyacid dehydrogenase n=1 Tax=Microbacterium sp. TPD7012 TaxID=2171975 RepID=UPI000D51AF89|nr:hydroxyacid dehydrogenase [Microbacterium sp. TPD7012]PVE94571.1 D-3-phosphoglycerate dehydrogenase [Microbacterium sp. TPD7012]